MLSRPRILYRFSVTIVFFVVMAHVCLADTVVRHYAGPVGGDQTVFTLNFADGAVSGSYHVLGATPARLRDYTLAGTLIGNHIQLSETAPLDVNASATIQGDFDTSPLLVPSASLTGSRILNISGLIPKPITLHSREFGPPLPATLSEKPINVIGPRNRYTVTGEYPVVIGDAGGRYDKFNAAAKALIDDQMRWFGKFETSGQYAALSEIRNPPDSMEVHYEILDFTPTLISMRYTMYTNTGGAHPNAATVTLNYDTAHDKILALSDLFTPSSNYLHTIAITVIGSLSHESDADYDMLVAGANSTPSNYEKWNLTTDGLVFTFDPYNIGPYSSGIQRFRFPLASLPPTKGIVAALVGGVR